MLINTDSYFQVLESVKAQIKNAQYRAVLGMNREQILLYWNIGKTIVENSTYGSDFIENLARDIKSEFSSSKGYSIRNLKYMREFAAFMSDEQKVQTVSALLSWSHNTYLFDKSKFASATCRFDTRPSRSRKMKLCKRRLHSWMKYYVLNTRTSANAPQGLNVNNRRWNSRSEWNRRIAPSLHPALQGLNWREQAAMLLFSPCGADVLGGVCPPVPLHSTDGYSHLAPAGHGLASRRRYWRNFNSAATVAPPEHSRNPNGNLKS